MRAEYQEPARWQPARGVLRAKVYQRFLVSAQEGPLNVTLPQTALRIPTYVSP